MEIEAIVSFVLLGFALVSFFWEKVSVDVTAIILLAAILFISCLDVLPLWPSYTQIFSVFSAEAPITIGAMFIISAALNRCRIMERMSNILGSFCKLGYTRFMLILLCLVALVSAFVNNTPVVVVLLPVIFTLSRKLGVSSSKMLIPVSYASIFGGCCTLLGTSTNILANGIIMTSEVYPNLDPIGMFELSKLGLPLLVISLGFLLLFGNQLLPVREGLTNILSDIEQKQFLAEAVVLKESPLIGKFAHESDIAKLSGTRVLDVIRRGVSLGFAKKNTKLSAGDKLILSCKPQGIIETKDIDGLDLLDEARYGIEQISSEESLMVEAVIGPSSPLISKTLKEANFRSRYNLGVLALHRKGKNLNAQLDQIRLEASDTILLMGIKNNIEKFRESEETILLDKALVPMENLKNKAPVALGILFLIIFTATFRILPISVAAVMGVAALLITGCVKAREAYQSIEWNILILIYGMLALGLAMQVSGASKLIASSVGAFGCGITQGPVKIVVTLIALYLITSILTELLSNAATIVIMAPISLEIAQQLNLTAYDARGFLLTTCIAASASFITPIGYQTNTFVYTVGGYKFSDFARIGIFLNLIYFTGTIILVSYYWDFYGHS
jgi:di/tricarboxylate transporter